MTGRSLVRTLDHMLWRRCVLMLMLAGALAACGDDTETAEVETTPSSSTSSTTAPGPETYGSLEPGDYPVDVGPGSVLTMLLNEMPDQDEVVALGFVPIPTQLESLPLLENCPAELPVARVERMAGQLSDDGQIFEVLVQAGATVWPSAEAAQAAADFYGTPEGVECEEREVERGFSYANQPGDPTLVDYEPAQVMDPIHDGIDGLRSFSKGVTSEQFGTPFEQTIESSIVVRGAVIWVFSVATLPDIEASQQMVDLGGAWLRDRTPIDVPTPQPVIDAASERVLSALEAPVERPSWFEEVSQVQLASTRLDDQCSSFLAEPIVAANGRRHVAVSQVAASSLSEHVATFETSEAAIDEVLNYESTILDCIRSETQSLLSVGFRRNDESTERLTVDGVEVVVTTVDLIQVVGDQEFDVRIQTALGASGVDAVHVSFEGLRDDEPDLADLVVRRLSLLAEAQ